MKTTLRRRKIDDILATQPMVRWLQHYDSSSLFNDLMAGIVVAILIIPQGMAYALLAGMPAEYGLYASMLPLLCYALLGSSRSLAVGPVAIASLMVTSALSEFAAPGSTAYIQAAINLALLVGLFLFLMHLLKLGSIVNFMSHSVISGFTSAAAVIIALSQLKHLLGLEIERGDFLASLTQTVNTLPNFDADTLLVGISSIMVLLITKKPLCCLLKRAAAPSWLAEAVCKGGPMFAIITGMELVTWLDSASVAIVGEIPSGIPALSLNFINPTLWQDLWMPALLIALIGYVESVSVGTALASKRRERIDPNRELLALGAANIGAAVSGTFPVAGGFGRSMVNFSAGAQTTIASLITAVLVALVVAFFTPLLTNLPTATLAAIILLAVLPLIDISSLRQAWRYNKGDALTLVATFIAVLLLGVELGIVLGIALSIAILLKRTSQPHIAIIGRVGASEHFRNIERHDVSTHPDILILRVDESLFFANTRYVEQFILAHIAQHPNIRHTLINCAAVNDIDASALETLENLSHQLHSEGICLHFSEIKGPVMDRLERVKFAEHLACGEIFFTTDEGVRQLETQC